MSFSEKLIELRKKEGISQEELGNRLNVTRQTVSKWELGQTTPELDKLVELSKIFNVSIDELTKEEQTNTTQDPVIENKQVDDVKRKRIIIICVAIAVVVLLFWGVSQLQKAKFANDVLGIFNNQTNMSEQIMGTAQGIIGTIADQMDEQLDDSENTSSNIKNELTDIYSEVQQQIEDVKNNIETQVDSFELKRYNSKFELYQGTQMGQTLRSLFDEIITNNKTQDKKVTLKFANKELVDGNKIKDLKSEIETFKFYEVSFEYDQDGYIYEASVENIK